MADGQEGHVRKERMMQVQQDVPVDAGGVDDGGAKAVIGEAKKYRKRAQAAEKIVDELQQQLSSSVSRVAELEQVVSDLERASRVDQLLIEADAVDLESARLLTAMAIEQMDEPDVAEAVAELKRRKPFLFRAVSRSSGVMGARADDVGGVVDAADRAASEAASTGHRSDLLRYLRLRRAAR